MSAPNKTYPGASAPPLPTATTGPQGSSTHDGGLQQPLLSAPAAHVAIGMDDTEYRRKQKKQAALSLCGTVVLVLIFLLSFLIPRRPSIELSGGQVGLSGVPLYVNASFSFHNRNWYPTTFSNLTFGLYTLSDTGVGVIGDAFFEGPIEVKTRGRKILNVGIATQKGTGLSIKQYCQTHANIIMFLSNASIHGTSKYKDFGTMGVYSPMGAIFMCPPPPPSVEGEVDGEDGEK
jgi:hypothetical protein